MTKPTGKPVGRPPWEPTKDQRLLVELCVANQFTRADIARLLGVSEDSLQRKCKEELEAGDIRMGAKISQSLMKKAMAGDTAAIIWWEKTRRGMSDKSKVEHSFDLSKLTDEELDALERIRARIATQP